MKRIIQFVAIMACLFLLFQLFVSFAKHGHKINYKIKTEAKEFEVEEEYRKDKKRDSYFLKITTGDYTFVYDTWNKYNKQSNIIKNIEYYESGDLLCIYPILNQEVNLEILCSDTKEIKTTEVLKQENDPIGENFISLLKEKKYTNNAWNSKNEKEEYNELMVYTDNLAPTNYIAVWYYRGIYIFHKQETRMINLLYSDYYENKDGRIVGNKYVIPDYDEKYQYEKLHITDLETGIKTTMKLKPAISTDSYINGQQDGKLYLFDRENLIQYEIDIEKNSQNQIGNKELNGRYYNGKWQDRNIYDFKEETLTFIDTVTPKEIESIYGQVKVTKQKNRYYFKTKENKIYVAYEEDLNHPVLLLQNSNMTNPVFVDDYVYYIVDNTLYQYHATTGVKPIIENNEFRFNHQNIYDVYKK